MPGEEPSLVCLVVLDGWGLAPAGPYNAVTLASTPNLDRLNAEYPSTTIETSGEAVGLPAGQMGNSEVGHLNLGAGRVVYQDLTRINRAISDGSFFDNGELKKAFAHAREHDSSMHLMGLLSTGGVHSDITHLKALIEMGKKEDCLKLFLHLFLDGRDVSPTSGAAFVKEIMEFLRIEKIGEISTISGRYYAMDRDRRWDRTRLAYEAIVHGSGLHCPDPVKLVKDSYARGETDEFLVPATVNNSPSARIRSGDSVIFFNFRPDRARQLTQALAFKNFNDFDRGEGPPVPYFVCMSEYDATYKLPVAFKPEPLKNVLAEVLAKAGKTQLHIAETEKYAHVTFFFNGGVEEKYTGEIRKLVPSPADVPTYDKKPEMSAWQVVDDLYGLLDQQKFDFVVVNLANCDMVGHTGNLEAAIEAVEVVDGCVGRIVDKVQSLGGICFITSDHGNAERMNEADGSPSTAHTSGQVPLIVTDQINLASGCVLGDVAPAVLKFLKITVPDEMSGNCLIAGINS